jgi:hypothetical protein
MTPIHKNDICDTRQYELTYIGGILPLYDVTVRLTQRDLRIILKHIEGRNDAITTLLKDFIQEIDRKEKRATDWYAKIPKTRVIKYN